VKQLKQQNTFSVLFVSLDLRRRKRRPQSFLSSAAQLQRAKGLHAAGATVSVSAAREN
jgi:hypothetical protein